MSGRRRLFCEHVGMAPAGFIPSPPENGFHLGPLFVYAYGVM
jgi:hypothetical protein